MDQKQVETPFPVQPRKARRVSEEPDQEELLQHQADKVLLRGRAELLQQLLLSPGWGVFSKIIEELMAEAASDADTSEGVSVYRSQGKKQVLRELNSRVNAIVEVLKEGEEDGKEESGS